MPSYGKGQFRYPLPSITAVFTAVLFSCGGGKLTYDLTEQGLVARTHDYSLPTKVFQPLFTAMQKARLPEGKEPRAALIKIIADKYLAAEYLRKQGGNPDPQITSEITKVYLETLAFYIRDKNPEKLFQSYIHTMTVPGPQTLRSLFDSNAPAAYTNVPLKRAEADKVILATYGKDKRKLTYSQLFDALPQAGKLHLFTAPHVESLQEILKTHLRGEFLNDYVKDASDSEKLEFAAVKAVVENSIYSRNLRYVMGMENANPHAENTAVKDRAKSVSFSRIKEYYELNKDKYKEVQSVDCRHIQIKDYDLAQNLRDKIEQGANMVELVKKHSLANDKNDAEPGLIKGIVNDPQLHTKPRIHTLCMSPKQGEVEVVKDSEAYHVIKAEKRTEGHPPLDDTTHLREDLAREIAALDLKKEFDEKKRAILKKVDIRINKAELETIK